MFLPTTVEHQVRRLRQRIFAASQVGDLKKVRNLQKLMLPTLRRKRAEVRGADPLRRPALDRARQQIGLAAWALGEDPKRGISVRWVESQPLTTERKTPSDPGRKGFSSVGLTGFEPAATYPPEARTFYLRTSHTMRM
ncbi:reverse transcriptase N-terminal domain-containing protein [Nocardia sp. R7R-8]|uniref:reverse transcriptase N-terminal domain-containing protein n=1 Tax=Nocardia sp. R7R-8 TaxID=3459304 RepID=UPI00403DCD92